MGDGQLAARLALIPEPAEGSVVAEEGMVWLRVTTDADDWSWQRIGDARPYSWREILREHWPVVVMREGW